VAYASAELTLTRGVADLTDYDRALGLDPTLRAAKRARDVLSGEQGRRTQERKRTAAAASLLLFSVLSVLLWRGARRPRRRLTPPPSAA
jgi:hypothetical protein